MGERKVVNKYYPADFDPSKVPRKKQQMRRGRERGIRMMVPMRLRCNTCGNYMHEGTKFNSRQEQVMDEMYLGSINVFRFYFRCRNCSAEIIIKTDPRNQGYVVESGATTTTTSTFQPNNWLDFEEKRRLDSKREMEIAAALDELKSSIKARQHATVITTSVDAMLDALHRSNSSNAKMKLEEDEEDEGEEESMIKSESVTSTRGVWRICDDEVFDVHKYTARKRKQQRLLVSSTATANKAPNYVKAPPPPPPVTVAKKKKPPPPTTNGNIICTSCPSTSAGTGLQSLLCHYSQSDDDED